MDRHQIRYLVEHQLLPQLYYQDKGQFVLTILRNKNVLYRIISEIFVKEDVENPYKESQFNVEGIKINDDFFLIKIIFPIPEEEPLCYESYLIFDRDFHKMNYFCVEKGNKEPFLCSWDKNSQHANYGNCTMDSDQNIALCVRIFFQNDIRFN